ncbi:hypothetical protein 2050HW_00040 [Serratia phage vB_SmaM_ 2050HW]|uniref:Uncharacterized protein n=1 Tax=Serratia phage vB_SmaM_ 2050HW TaxID=2024252 RepID=A0A289Z708_9CAUD|nr:hypothetical protein HWB23_gp040 [Serratia phage vB_SmaM_ 2050HW]ATA65375.1 hypothetical protein 2050HW_00040 [Serratia phage vB_SmaM_ 2050HW]UCR74661.1 hypothetical protein [Serratia phage BUCT660]
MTLKKSTWRTNSTILNPKRLDVLNKELEASQVTIEVRVVNLLNHPVMVKENSGNRHVVNPKNVPAAGRCIAISVVFSYANSLVKINADHDYSEEYIHDVLERYKGFASVHVDDTDVFNRFNRNYSRLVMAFDERNLKSLGNLLEIAEWGISIDCSRDAATRTLESEFIEAHLPNVKPDNDCRYSGVCVTLNDPDNRLPRAFYRIGSEVFEIDLDRTAGCEPGVELAAWNIMMPSMVPMEETRMKFSIDEALSGENPLGLKVFTSLEEAYASPENELKRVKDEVAKEKVKQRDDKRTSVREEKLKFGHGILKIFNEAVKTTLPILVSWGAKLFGIFKRSSSIMALI